MERTTLLLVHLFFGIIFVVSLYVVKRVTIIYLFRITHATTHHFEGHYAPKQSLDCVTHENCEAIYRIVYFKIKISLNMPSAAKIARSASRK